MCYFSCISSIACLFAIYLFFNRFCRCHRSLVYVFFCYLHNNKRTLHCIQRKLSLLKFSGRGTEYTRVSGFFIFLYSIIYGLIIYDFLLPIIGIYIYIFRLYDAFVIAVIHDSLCLHYIHITYTWLSSADAPRVICFRRLHSSTFF